jgi:streptogramin lyase
MDAEDRLWFAEYNGDKIGMLDTRTEKIQEWPTRKYWTPYAASKPDKKGRVYATSNMTDQVLRLDPSTGAIVEYLMPTELDAKKIALDPNGTVWMTNMRTARVLRIEPLD